MTLSPRRPNKLPTIEREFEFLDRHFQFLRQLAGKHAGINLTEAKRDLVYGRITRRLRALKLTGFDAYCDLLTQQPHEELGDFINAITTNLTSFFREPHHFDFIRDHLLPNWRATRGAAPRLRCWSAGCSTGEEPYSLAMTLLDALPVAACHDVKILATDIDTNVLAHAAAGIYGLEPVLALSAPQRRRWFRRGKDPHQNHACVVPALRQVINFLPLNLMDSWPMKGPLDLIFCRNVVIYFDKPTQRRLFDRYAELLAPDGHLIIGHSETLYGVSDQFELVGRTTYRKISPSEGSQ
ncbi:MAG: protein-glutamate O-methyltransferase CheR [Gammaproteobacteria bacterium]|nr:protein-glutamate O-methyltransferase CheR [Gammaproteobacteria bacterium]